MPVSTGPCCRLMSGSGLVTLQGHPEGSGLNIVGQWQPMTCISSTCGFALLCPEGFSHLTPANICLFLKPHSDIICLGNFPWLPLKTKVIITSSVPPLCHVHASGAALVNLCASGYAELNVCPTIWGLSKAGETLSDSALSLGPPILTGCLGAGAQ